MESSLSGVNFCAPPGGGVREPRDIAMHRHVVRNVLGCALISAALAIGCDEGGGNEKLSLSTVIPDPVTIDLGLTLGTLTFDFSSHPLDLDRQEDLEMFLFTGGIAVTAVNDATDVTYTLNEGTEVMTLPDEAGEYLVSSSEDGKTVTIRFYNWLNGRYFTEGGDYSATIDVLENEFFATETFARDVVVTQ
jgi:hypothetical protein